MVVITQGTTIKNTYSIRIANTIEEIEKNREIWESLQGHPNVDIDFFLTILQSRHEIVKPHVIIIFYNGIPKTMAIGRLELCDFNISIGYKSVYKPKVRMLKIIYSGLLGEINKEITNILVSELIKYLESDEADIILFSNLNTKSEIVYYARKIPNILARDYIKNSHLHWSMGLPQSLSEFYNKMSGHRRQQLGRYKRVLEKTFPNQIETQFFQKPDQVEKICMDAEEIAKKTYQRGLGTGFIYNNEIFNRLYLSAKKNCLYAYILYIKGRPCSFWIATLYKQTLYIDFTGFDPNLKIFQPGTVLFVYMIEILIKKNIKNIDFGFGDAFYKSRFGNKNWKETDVYIFSSKPRILFINVSRTFILLLSKIIKHLLFKVKTYDKVKRLWRNNLTRKPNIRNLR